MRRAQEQPRFEGAVMKVSQLLDELKKLDPEMPVPCYTEELDFVPKAASAGRRRCAGSRLGFVLWWGRVLCDGFCASCCVFRSIASAAMCRASTSSATRWCFGWRRDRAHLRRRTAAAATR